MAPHILLRLRRFRRPAAALALGLAAMLVAARLIPIGDTPVVVTAQPVTAGNRLGGDDVEVVGYPASLVPDGGLDTVADARGARARMDLPAGVPITASMLRSGSTLPTKRSHVAFPLHLADGSAAGLLHPGDHIIVFRRGADGGRAAVAADDVVVLKVKRDAGSAGGLGSGTESALVTIDVGKSAARRLAGAATAYTFALLGS